MRIEIAVDARNWLGEGPFWDDREGRLWWVDIPAHEVLSWSPGEPAPQRWPVPDFPSAIVGRERGGFLLAMRSGVYGWEPDSANLIVLATPDVERPDNRSNDAKCDPFGRFWLGTMQNNMHEDGSDRPMTASTGSLYCVLPDGRWRREVDGVGLANTLAWTDDGRTLLFADTKTGVISRYAMDEEGRLTPKGVFSDTTSLPGHCDGSTIDAEGFLWNCRFGGGRLIRFRPDGSVDREVGLPVTNPTSCCFGSSDLRTLYVTSARSGLSEDQLRANPLEGAMLALEPGVEGTPSHRFAG
jgi:sugar lactone lactonase YvrE